MTDNTSLLPVVAPEFAWLKWRALQIHSQFGEDGIIAAIVERMAENVDAFGWCVDIGASDGVKFSNTRALVERGWFGILVEKDETAYGMLVRNCRGKNVLPVHAAAEPEGDNSPGGILLTASIFGNKIPSDFDVLSIDVDGTEYYLLKSAWESGFKPKIVCVEHYDAVGPKAEDDWVPELADCGKRMPPAGHSAQATAPAIDRLAAGFGYVPVARTRTNSIYVRAEFAAALSEANHGLDDGIRLNVGAGPSIIPGFIPIDIKDGGDAEKLPYEDGTVSEVYASHVLEHLPHGKTMDVLREWNRVLKPDGKLYVSVPDLEKILSAEIPFQKKQTYLMGGQIDENDLHRTMFTRQSIQAMLEGAAFDFVGEFEPFIRDCSSLPISANMCGFKRAFRKIPMVEVAGKEGEAPRLVPKPKICAVSSWGRLTFSDQADALLRLMEARIVDVHMKVGSVYWQKAITAAIERVLESDCDWILFTDGDTLHVPDDVRALIKILNEQPDVSIAFAVQASRHEDRPILFREENDYTGETSHVTFGHFGLTLCRREVFERLPQPWFICLPDPKTGRWGKGSYCSDSDMHFWRLAFQFGFKAVQANHVNVGHLELVSKWLTDTPGGVGYQPMGHYYKHGKPEHARFDQKAVPRKGAGPIG